jgi:hypothetical protein
VINSINLLESYSRILPFSIRLFDVVNQKETYSCATSHTSQTIIVSICHLHQLVFQAHVLLVCFLPQKHIFPFGRHPTTLLQSYALRLLTGDNCTTQAYHDMLSSMV